MVVDAVSNEKGVDKDIIFEAIEAALLFDTKLQIGCRSLQRHVE